MIRESFIRCFVLYLPTANAPATRNSVDVTFRLHTFRQSKREWSEAPSLHLAPASAEDPRDWIGYTIPLFQLYQAAKILHTSLTQILWRKIHWRLWHSANVFLSYTLENNGFLMVLPDHLQAPVVCCFHCNHKNQYNQDKHQQNREVYLGNQWRVHWASRFYC